jgi:hypothetical protein
MHWWVTTTPRSARTKRDVAQAEGEEVPRNCRPQLSSKHTPASVSDTLRVVRFSRRSPGRFSSSRVELLAVEAITPSLDTAARKLSWPAIVTKAVGSVRVRVAFLKSSQYPMQ